MNILVANDDGIQAKGIAKLTEALSLAGHDVYVIAPNGQRSAYSHAISINKDVLFSEVEDYPFAKEAYMVDGTPADCVKLGTLFLKKRGIRTEAVYTGINHGANLGTDTMYSGTVSSAAEGAFLGLPSVAVSLININAPDLEACEIKGTRAARLGNAKYDEWYYEAEDNGETVTYRYAGTMIEDETWTDDMDTKLVREGYITVSAIKYDLNDYAGFEALKKWEAIK